PAAEAFRRLPAARRHRHLRPLALGHVGPEHTALDARAVFRQQQLERRAGVIVPGLDLRDAVPVRRLALLEQVIDRCRIRTAIDLAEPAAFRMRREFERADDGVGVRHSAIASAQHARPHPSRRFASGARYSEPPEYALRTYAAGRDRSVSSAPSPPGLATRAA